MCRHVSSCVVMCSPPRMALSAAYVIFAGAENPVHVTAARTTYCVYCVCESHLASIPGSQQEHMSANAAEGRSPILLQREYCLSPYNDIMACVYPGRCGPPRALSTPAGPACISRCPERGHAGWGAGNRGCEFSLRSLRRTEAPVLLT